MSHIKQSFVSRYGKNGYLVEIDFSQLEIFGLALLTKDPELVRDLKNGIDQHAESATWLDPSRSYDEVVRGVKAGDRYFISLRKAAKAARFALQYGAYAPKIASVVGCSVGVAERFIDQYYKKYQKVKEWQDNMEKNFDDGRKIEYVGSISYPRAYWEYESITGRRYRFESADLSTKAPTTKLKNYPVQGFATGDLVTYVLTLLAKWTCYSGWKVSLIGSVHDSFLLDVEVPERSSVEDVVKHLEEKVEVYARMFLSERGISDLGLKIKAEGKYGKTWEM